MSRVITFNLLRSLINKWKQKKQKRQLRQLKKRRLTIRVEASALADGVPILDVLPPATSKGVRPVLPNKERKKHKATASHSKPFNNT